MAHRQPERAEPRSIGTSGTANVLAREVRLLGALLGQVIVEQAGTEVFDLVESPSSDPVSTRSPIIIDLAGSPLKPAHDPNARPGAIVTSPIFTVRSVRGKL